MTDQNSQFFAILTAIGEAKQANADALGVPWTFAQMGVGDANGTEPMPSRAQTKLINERRRAPLNQIKVDPTNSSIIIAEQVIPPDVGGWWIREIGLYDAAGDLVAVANCAPSFKPLLNQGTGKTQVVRLNLIVTSTANVELKIDPAVVLATRSYVDTSIVSVLPPNKAAGTYTQVRIDERGIVQLGFNPTTLAGYNIADAFTRSQTTASIQAAITSLVDGAGSSLDTLAKLAAALGYNPHFADDVTAQIATKASKSTTLGGYGIGDAYTKAQADQRLAEEIAKVVSSAPGVLDTLAKLATAVGNNPNFAGDVTSQIATKASKSTTLGGYGIGDAYTKGQVDQRLADEIARLIGSAPGALDTLDELAAALGDDPNFAATITNQLALKAPKATTLAGYGIGDALRNENPLPNGNLDLHGTTVSLVSAQGQAALFQNVSWNGSTISKHVAGQAAVSISAQAGKAYVGKWAANSPGGDPTSNYEIIDAGMQATPDELDAGAANSKWVSVSGVARMIGRLVKSATESAAGVAAIASQAVVNAGADDTQIVTSKKLRWGFTYSFGLAGYIFFPQWLGGFAVQWMTAEESTSATDFKYFPVPFPNGVFGAWTQLSANLGFGANYGTILEPQDTGRFLWCASGTWGGGLRAFIFAIGH